MIEILAPAGDENSAYAAISAGADAIYLGLTAFSARSSAKNFDLSALKKLVADARLFGVKIYVAMNTLVKESELQSFVQTAVDVWNIGADAIIIQDIYLGAYLKKTYPQMVLHLSTQAGICNEYGARYAKELGFSRVILARETRIEDVKKIADIIETEVFVQGALCTCFSGQCYLSSFAGGNSGNRGKCKQPCRKKYKINRKGFEEYAYRISLSDLCVGEDAEKYIQAGVASFKIEGRMRRAEYVSAAVNYYKALLDNGQTKAAFSALKRTYNRGNYTKGLAFGQDKSLISSAVQGHIGEYIGVISVENGAYICRTQLRGGEGDGYKILRNGKELCGAVFYRNVKGGQELKSRVRLKSGDKVFITTDSALNTALTSKKCAYIVDISAKFMTGEPPEVTLNGMRFTAEFTAEAARSGAVSAQDVINCFSKVAPYPFSVNFSNVYVEDGLFVPMSLLNAFRRGAYAALYLRLTENSNERIEEVLPLPVPCPQQKNDLTCVVARDLLGVEADIGVLKPDDYSADFSPLLKGFDNKKFLYLPPYLTGAEIERIKPLVAAFDGIYCGGNYAVLLARELKKELFCGVGFNLSNSLSLSLCPAEFIALSKELTVAEAAPLARANTFYLASGDIKVMDLIYCPFSRTCKDCDKRPVYVLTDEDGRAFPLRRYKTSECRFELYNCAYLQSSAHFTGILKENSLPSEIYASRTKGHTESPVL